MRLLRLSFKQAETGQHKAMPACQYTSILLFDPGPGLCHAAFSSPVGASHHHLQRHGNHLFQGIQQPRLWQHLRDELGV